MAYGVVYPLPKGHCEYVLFHLDKQRSDSTLCDIDLQVNQRTISAHKGVLCVSSDYFSAMFRGSYMEKDSKHIDLSETFSNADALETVIRSMYLGSLEIKDSDDICDILEICSILLFDDAKKQCIDCLKTRLCLRNGLKFWFAADRYLDEKQAKRFRNLVESHFHDFYINQPELVEMSPRDLLYLFQQNFHKFCSPLQLLEFLLCWFLEGSALSEDLASIFHQVSSKIVSDDGSTQTFLLSINTFLSNPGKLAAEYNTKETKCQEFCSVLKKLIPNVPSVDKSKLICRKTLHADVLLQCGLGECVDALLVAAPMPHILEKRFHLYTDYIQSDKACDLIPLFHVSAYIPQTRTWFKLGQISSPPYLNGEKLTGFFDSCFMEYCKDSLYAIGDLGEKNMKCNMETFLWQVLPPLSECVFSPSSIGEANLRLGVRIIQPIATNNSLLIAAACQREEVVHVGLLELQETVGESPVWVQKVPFKIPPALFGFTLVTAEHCVRRDRFVYVLLIGRMHSVHCKATCLASFDILEGTVRFLPVPEEYLIEPYHWTMFEQHGSLLLAHKTTFMYRYSLRAEVEEETKCDDYDDGGWHNCSEDISIKGDHKLPSLYAKSWGKFRRLNGVTASKDSLWVIAEKRLVDRWHAATLWEIKVDMKDKDAQQQVIRHVPSSYSCYSLAAPITLSVSRLNGLELCQCVHPE